MRALTVFVLVCFSAISALGQNLYIQGVILDATSKEPVPFANVVLRGSYQGTASNFDGEFVLAIKEENKSDTLIISVVGFKTQTYKVSDYLGEKFHKFMLAPFVYEIQDITVETKSQFYNTVIKRAAEHISKNYYQGPFNYEMYYRNTQKVNGNVSKERQAAIRLYDSKGYTQASTFNVFKERGYDFLQVRRDFELNTLEDGSTKLDDLLEFDVVRHTANVLNKEYVYSDYDVSLDRMSAVDGDSVWVLKFKCKSPGLGSTGDSYAKAYKGKLYIKKKDYALIKYEAEFECSNYSDLGRSLYVNEQKQNYQPMTIGYKVTTRYKEYNGKYFLSSVAYERSHKWKHKKNGALKTEKVNSELLVTNIEVKQPKMIPNRAYYEEIPFDKKFWESFNYLKDEKKK